MKFHKYLFSALSLLMSLPVFASDFFSTEQAEEFFTFGVRAGVNASNRTFPSQAFNAWNVNSWGSGLQVGAVANINFREYLSIQPGFFFESRSGNYSYAADYITSANTSDRQYQLGHMRSYDFNIPVMAIGRFNLSDELKWLVELGPYFQFNLHSSDGDQIIVLERGAISNTYMKKTAETNVFDFGIKMGSGLLFKEHYYFGIHYLAGILDVWKYPKGGKNKEWTFTLGYNF